MATARKLPSGKWRVYQYVGMQDGKRRYESFTAATKKEAEYAAAEYMMAKKKKTSAEKITVGTAMDRYIEARSEVLSPSTIRGYKIIRKNNLQGLMDVYLDDLTQEQIQIEISKSASTLSPKTQRNIHGLLSATLREYLPDLVLRTKFSQKKSKKITVPEKEEVKQLLLATRGTALFTAIILGESVGLRRSEMCALTWDDVDFENNQLRINKAMVRNAEGDWVIKDPKSEAGTREVDIPNTLTDYLRTLPRKTDRVVPLLPCSVTSLFRLKRDKLGFTFRLHDLRHYNASVMLAMGIPDLYAMERMGHATTDMLKRVYQHTMNDKRKEVGLQINSYFDDMHHEMHHDE